MVHAIVDSAIRIVEGDLPPRSLALLHRALSFPNPEFALRERMGRWTCVAVAPIVIMLQQKQREEMENKMMDFGEALNQIKEGKCVARKGWNGKGMYVFLVDFSEIYPALGYKKVEPCLTMKTAQDTLQPGWLASQADMLAEDWEIVIGG